MVFTTWCSYANTVLGVVILSVCHTRALWLIQRTYRWYFYTTWKGNPSSQMWFFVQLCSSWQDFNWLKASHGPSVIAELIVTLYVLHYAYLNTYVVFAKVHTWHVHDVWQCCDSAKQSNYCIIYWQEAQLSLRDRATRACQLKSGKVLHKCRRLVFEKLWN